MSDKLQFVDASMESDFAADDKLKFIGHKAPSPLRSAGALLCECQASIYIGGVLLFVLAFVFPLIDRFWFCFVL